MRQVPLCNASSGIDGDITESDALERIANALKAREQLLALLDEGETISDARARFTHMARYRGTLAPADARFVVLMFAFERMLDAHFRKPRKGRLPVVA